MTPPGRGGAPRRPRPASPGLTLRHFPYVARRFRRGRPARSADGTSGSGAVPPPSWAGSGAAAAAAAERVPPWEDAAGGAGGGGEDAGGGGGTRAERGRGGGGPRRAAPEAGAAAARVHLPPRPRAVPHRQRLPGRDQLRVRPWGRGPRRRLCLPGAAAGTRPYSLQHHGEARGAAGPGSAGSPPGGPGTEGCSFAGTGLSPLGPGVNRACAPTSLAVAAGGGCPRSRSPWGLRELLGAAAHAENNRGAAPPSRCTRAGRSPWCLEPPVPSRCSSPGTEPSFPRFPPVLFWRVSRGALISLEKRNLRQQRQLLLPALAHPHRCFRDPGAGVLVPSLITSYCWFVSPDEES